MLFFLTRGLSNRLHRVLTEFQRVASQWQTQTVIGQLVRGLGGRKGNFTSKMIWFPEPWIDNEYVHTVSKRTLDTHYVK